MSNFLTINTINNSININNFFCTLDEFKQIEPEFNLSLENILEIRCSDDILEAQYQSNNDGSLFQLAEEIRSILLAYINNVENYVDKLNILQNPPLTLSQAAQNKQNELNNYYLGSGEAWNLTVSQGKNALSGKNWNWWQIYCTTFVASNQDNMTLILFTPKGQPIAVIATQEVIKSINSNLITIAQGLSQAYRVAQTAINNFTDINAVLAYDIKTEFNKINRIIAL